MARSRLYFAYGSNTWPDQMFDRCPGAQVIGPAVLADWQLVFRGVADIVRKPGASVPGVLWHLPAADEAKLDRYEGFPRKYVKETIRVKNGPVLMAYVFRVPQAIRPPRAEYLARITKGYELFGLPTKALKRAIRAARKAREAERAWHEDMGWACADEWARVAVG